MFRRPPGTTRTDTLVPDTTLLRSGLRGVLDWELSHRGDAMEDLGWLCLRSWRFGCDALPVGGFGERAAFYEHYQTASGIPVDIAAVHFWEVLGDRKSTRLNSSH